MYARVGLSDNPDSIQAAKMAVRDALSGAGRETPCDLVLLFSTANHDFNILRSEVIAALGANVPIVGGGAVGGITNSSFGYAGDQVILAALWLSGTQCDIVHEGDLQNGEGAAGERLGSKLAELGITPESSLMLFYDAVHKAPDGMRIIMATHLLEGIQKTLGFLPNITGAGLQGNHQAAHTLQFTGDSLSSYNALALHFSGEVRIDSTIMHGCRPATGYYTVTKADAQTILEINGQPALTFIDSILHSAITPDEYPFFLILGVNRGEKWGEYDENNYASRLCLGIDKERGGLVMFEPDMTEGTEFQIMFRSLEVDYIGPKIEALFASLENEVPPRKPVFATYIDCAGRAAGYSGEDLEDAVAVQKAVANRAPLMGIYTGVEIAPIQGRPRGLDWTGVFSLFSVPR